MGKWIRKSGYDTCLQAGSDTLNTHGLEIHLIRFYDGKFRHYHKQTSEFFHFTAGNGRVLLADREIPLSAGSSLLIPPNTVHTFYNDSPEIPLEALLVKTNTNPDDTYPCN